MSATFGSVCSGIEAASVAWRPLGWRAAWLSEIEPFPSTVLAHHYPNVPNLGDMRTLARRVLTGEVPTVDVLVGGTPCQAYSVAGLRKGLSDERGQLTIKYVDLINANDFIRARRGKRPAIIVWENVPGVLSSKDNAFGCFLAGIAGEDHELESPRGKWPNAGIVVGPTRTVAWRILDAQYFGVAQRRRRVFVVASARKDFDPGAVLFEFDGVRRDSAPRREQGQDVAGSLTSRTDGGGFPGTDEACSGYVQPVAATLLAKSNCSFDHTLETYVAQHASTGDVSHCLNAGGMGRQDFETETLITQQRAPIAIGFSTKDYGGDASREIAPTMRAMGSLGSHANSGGQLGVAIAFDSRQDPVSSEHVFGSLGSSSPQAQAVCITGDVTHTLKGEGFDASEDGTGRGQPIVAAFDMQQITSPHNRASVRDNAPAPTISRVSRMHAAIEGMAVRRLTPVECERLQGFPDGYTAIPWNGWRAMDASETPESCRAEGLEVRQNKKTGKWRVKDVDGPRYKALGNSMAIPPMRWIGSRINPYVNGS